LLVIWKADYSPRLVTRPSDDRRRLGLGLGLVLGSAITYGATPIVAKLAFARGIRPLGLLAYRFLVAAVCFTVLDRRPDPKPERAARRLALWGLGCVYVGNAGTYFFAIETVPASILVLVLYTYPALVTFLAALLGFEPLTLRGVASAGLVCAGVALTAGRLSGPGPATLGSLGLAFASAFIYASYVLLSARYAVGVPPRETARRVSEACAFVFVLWALARGELWLGTSPQGWALVLTAAVVCTVVPLLAFLAGLARIGAGRAAIASAFEVVVTLGLAAVILKEDVSPVRWLGGGLIVGGVALQAARRVRHLPKDAEAGSTYH
jgi:drug/metabolite transporter (DMT)-like permease